MKRASGLTLVEVMIAMLLVLIVSAGALAFVARGRAAQRTGEAIARLEETTDAALAILVEDLRLAGYLGLSAPGSPVAGASPLGTVEAPELTVAGGCGLSLAHDLGAAVSAADGAFSVTNSNPRRCSAGPQGRVVAGSDTLTLRHASTTATDSDPGRLQLETNLRAARLMADGAPRLGESGRIHDLEVSVFYVSADSTAQRGWPSLRRKRLVGGSRPTFQDEELVTGIEDLQVEIGLDAATDQDNAVDRWVTPTEVAGADAPRAVRLWVRARSDLPEHPAVDQPALSYANRDEPRASLHFRRKLSSRIVELRNLEGAP